MNLFFSYFRMFVFLGCTLVGMQVPAFVDQYGKSLESHLRESQVALQEFQADADRYFNGRLEELIAHYIDNQDQIFSDGGRSIQSIHERNLLLRTSFEQFHRSPWSAYTQALFTPVADVSDEVRKSHSYAVQLRSGAIAFGLVVGLLFTFVLELVLRALPKAGRLLLKEL